MVPASSDVGCVLYHAPLAKEGFQNEASNGLPDSSSGPLDGCGIPVPTRKALSVPVRF